MRAPVFKDGGLLSFPLERGPIINPSHFPSVGNDAERYTVEARRMFARKSGKAAVFDGLSAFENLLPECGLASREAAL